MAARACRCGGIVRDGVCDRCGPKDREHYRTTTERGYGADWQRVSRLVRTEQPLCVVCEAEGRVTAASEVHHVRRIQDDPGRRLERENLMAVCRECHERIETDGTSYSVASGKANGGLDAEKRSQ